MKAIFQQLRLAIGFLTLLPVGDVGKSGGTKLEKTLYLFPLVGLLIGAICVAIGLSARLLLFDPLHVALVLTTSAIITGGLHLDGLADTFDALGSWRSKQRKLEIMKDSRIGVMGAVALILMLLLKFSALVALGERWWIGALLAPLWGRWAAVCAIHFFPKARSKDEHENGSASLAHAVGNGSRTSFIVACLLTWSVSGVVLYQSGAPVLQQLITPILAITVCLIAARKLTKSLGGLTGDTYGAINELTEAALLLALCSGTNHS